MLSDTRRSAACTFLADVAGALLERPLRTALTLLGPILGVGMLVATQGVASTSAAATRGGFDVLTGTQLSAVQNPAGVRTRSLAVTGAGLSRVADVDGVLDVGVYWRVPSDLIGEVRGTTLPWRNGVQVDVAAASERTLDVSGAHFATGRGLDSVASRGALHVAVVGSAAARQLNLPDLRSCPALWIGGYQFAVIGIVDSSAARPEILSEVVVPDETARLLWGDPAPEDPARVWVHVRAGSAAAVAALLPTALEPSSPETFDAQPPPEPASLRMLVSTNLVRLLSGLALLSLIGGMAVIGAVMWFSVGARTSEIGLRRALGCTPVGIVAQFVAEAAVAGGFAGLVGAALGTVTTLVFAAVRMWHPVVPWAEVLSGPLIGAVCSAIAGTAAAVGASRVEPVVALRSTL